MGNVVDIERARLEENSELVGDLARFAEGLMDERTVRKKYKFPAGTWEALGSDDVLVAAVELEKTRRIRDGSCKRERAQQLVVKAPDVLNTILLDKNANAKHRIDSAKALDSLAVGGESERTASSELFRITINIGNESLTFAKPFKPDDVVEHQHADDVIEHQRADAGETDWAALIAAKKKLDGGNGNAI
jgi:hypothetical protein